MHVLPSAAATNPEATTAYQEQICWMGSNSGRQKQRCRCRSFHNHSAADRDESDDSRGLKMAISPLFLSLDYLIEKLDEINKFCVIF
jgi:hypothetical protein